MKKISLKTIMFTTVSLCAGVIIGVATTIATLSEGMSNIKATKTKIPKTLWRSFVDWLNGK